MSQLPAKQESNVVAIHNPDAWTDARREFIRKNFASGAPDQFVDLFLKLCERRNLSPEAKHIYLVPRKTKNRDGSYSTTWTPQTSIDGQRLIAARTGTYAGSDDAIFLEGELYPTKATVTVYRVVGGVRCPFTASAYWKEYYPGDGPAGTMWRSLPHVMLAKVAESAALRKAFPEDLSGMYTDDEMQQATVTEANFREITPDMPQMASTTTESDVTPPDGRFDPEPPFDERLFDAVDEKDPSERKQRFGALYSEAVAERDTTKLRKIIAYHPTYAAAKAVLDSAADKHDLNDQAMIDALASRSDNPNRTVVDQDAGLTGTMTDLQRRTMFAIQKEIGMTDADLKNWIKDKFDIDSRTQLSEVQAEQVIGMLKELQGGEN